MPVYEVPVLWFREALASVDAELERFEAAHPTGDPCEIVIVDDGSEQEDLQEELTDLGVETPRGIAVRVIHLPKNLGVAGALNAGLQECQNPLVARFDSDDIMLSGRLGAQYAVMSRDHEVSCLSTGLNYLREAPGSEQGWVRDPNVVAHPERITREIAKSSFWFMNHPTVMMRKEHVLRAGGYDSSLRGYSEDYELWIRMLLKGMALRNLQTSYHLLRLSNASATKSFNPANWEFLQRTQARLQ